LVPIDRSGHKNWNTTARINRDKAQAALEDLDVVFLGDSITEGWKGTSLGNLVGKKKDNPAVYDKYFTMKGGGDRSIAFRYLWGYSEYLYAPSPYTISSCTLQCGSHLIYFGDFKTENCTKICTLQCFGS